MGRLPELDEAELTAEQRRVYEAVLASRGSLYGPFRTWLQSPEFGQRAQHLGEFVRYHTSIGPRLSELAILVTVRHQNCQLAWSIHEEIALEQGLDPAVIDAVRSRRRPAFDRPDEAAVHDFVDELLRQRVVADPTFEVARRHLEARGVVELVGIVGYYCMTTMTLNAFEVPLPDGIQPRLDDCPTFT